MINENLKNQIKRKIKKNQRQINLYEFNQQAQKQVNDMLKKKKVLELAFLSMELFSIESPSISGRLLGYFKNSKFVKVVYTFKDNMIKYKVEGKEYIFNLNEVSFSLVQICTKYEKNKAKLKSELLKFIKTL